VTFKTNKKKLTDKKILITSLIATILIFGSIPLDAFALTLDEIAKLTASDEDLNDFFGVSVAISGDTAVVGAKGNDDAGNDSGSAYVYKENGATWTEEAKLTASDAAAKDFFGVSVAISGDTAVVGAFGDESSTGAAYVYTRSGTIWTEEAKLTASDGVAFDEFGASVSISGDTVVVGANGNDDAVTDLGAAYVFTRSGTTWTEEAKLTASDGGFNFFTFGFSVSVSGDTAVVGAFGEDGLTGSAHVFTRSGTTWTEEAKLTASDGVIRDLFGVSVAISGDTAVVGAFGDESSNNELRTGAAYVFTRSGTTWTEEAKLTASDRTAFDAFGFSVSVSGDTAVVGANTADEEFTGAAYVYTRSGTTWTEEQKITASDGVFDAEFGNAVANSGDKVVIGAFGGGSVIGSAYVFEPAVSPDTDNDGIFNEIDTLPNTFSDDFSDIALGGTTSGTITTRGDQTLAITEEANPDGVRIAADIGGGPEKARMDVCSGASNIKLSAGDVFIVTCTSVTIKVISGTIEVTLVGDTGQTGIATINGGNELTFEPETFTFSAGSQNTETIVIIDGGEIILNPGNTIRVVNMDIKPGSDPNCFNNNGNGVIPVAILGSTTFDVNNIDSESVTLEGMAIKVVGKSNKLLAHIEDTNSDGIDDLIVQIEDQDGVFEIGDTIATISGQLLDGTTIVGSDSICITQ